MFATRGHSESGSRWPQSTGHAGLSGLGQKRRLRTSVSVPSLPLVQRDRIRYKRSPRCDVDACKGSAVNEKSDVQDAIDALAKENAELSFAFYGFVSLVSGFMTKGLSFDANTLADEYEELAREAGERLASVSGDNSEPNKHLQFIANIMRNLDKPTLRAIDGGRAKGTDPD